MFVSDFLLDEVLESEVVRILRYVDFSGEGTEVFMLLDFEFVDVKDVWMVGSSSPCESVADFFKGEILIEGHGVERVLSGGWIGGKEKRGIDVEVVDELEEVLVGEIANGLVGEVFIGFEELL